MNELRSISTTYVCCGLMVVMTALCIVSCRSMCFTHHIQLGAVVQGRGARRRQQGRVVCRQRLRGGVVIVRQQVEEIHGSGTSVNV